MNYDSGNRARKTVALFGTMMTIAFLDASAHAEERMIKAKHTTIACQDSSLIANMERLARSDDDKAFHGYLKELMLNPNCKVISSGKNVYVEQMDVLDKGLKLGLQGALSEAFGFKVPAAPSLIRIRVQGETVWRYTLLQGLL